jgi:putative transposase
MFTGIMEIFALIAHLLSTLVRVALPGGVRAVIVESLLLKHQLLVLSRSRKRAPRLTPWDRLLFGVGAFIVSPKRLPKIAIAIRPSTRLHFHRALIQRKYRLLFTPAARRRPGPKGPSKELIAAILEMKRRNPRFGCPRIAQQIAHAFGVDIGKDVVRRILAQHFRPPSGGDGPSWLTLIGDTADSLWSVDLFRCESIALRSYWVLVVMDLFTRRIVGSGVAPTPVDGVAVCRMFNHARSGEPLPGGPIDLRIDHALFDQRHHNRSGPARSDAPAAEALPVTISANADHSAATWRRQRQSMQGTTSRKHGRTAFGKRLRLGPFAAEPR